jgi:hypothetical protein
MNAISRNTFTILRRKEIIWSNFADIAFDIPMGLNPEPPTHGETMYSTYNGTVLIYNLNCYELFLKI